MPKQAMSSATDTQTHRSSPASVTDPNQAPCLDKLRCTSIEDGPLQQQHLALSASIKTYKAAGMYSAQAPVAHGLLPHSHVCMYGAVAGFLRLACNFVQVHLATSHYIECSAMLAAINSDTLQMSAVQPTVCVMHKHLPPMAQVVRQELQRCRQMRLQVSTAVLKVPDRQVEVSGDCWRRGPSHDLISVDYVTGMHGRPGGVRPT